VTNRPISNVPVSRPIDLRIDRHAELGGFGWNADEGLFFPVDDPDTELYDLPPESESGGASP
jgi:hypothetical protein